MIHVLCSSHIDFTQGSNSLLYAGEWYRGRHPGFIGTKELLFLLSREACLTCNTCYDVLVTAVTRVITQQQQQYKVLVSGHYTAYY